MHRLANTDVLPAASRQKTTPSFTGSSYLVENHDEAYYLWRDAGVRNLPVIHIDPHHDMWPIENAGATTVGSYLFRAMREGIVSDFYWIVPDASVASENNLESLMKNLTSLPGVSSLKISPRRIEAHYQGHKIYVCAAGDLPALSQRVLLDVDVDYFTLPLVSAPEVHEVPEELPCSWPVDLVEKLTHLDVEMLTVGYSVNGGTTPLRWKYLGEEFVDRFAGEDSRLEYFDLLRSAARCGLEETSTLLERAVQSLPDNPTAHFHLAEILERQGDLMGAKSEYAAAIACDPSYGCAYNCFGPCMEAAGESKKAELEYQRILRMAPGNAHALCGLGRIAATCGDWLSAESLAQQALSHDADSIEAQHLRGDAAMRNQQVEIATSAYESYLGLLSNGVRSLATPISTKSPGEDVHELPVRFRLARLYRGNRDWEKAEQQYRWLSGRAVPNVPMAAICLHHAKSLVRLGRRAEAAGKGLQSVAALPRDAFRAARKLSGAEKHKSQSPARDVLLNVVRMVFTSLCSIITSAILARTLGAGDMGIYSYALWITGVMVGVSHFGLPTALSKFVAESTGKNGSPSSATIIRTSLKVQAAVILGVMIVGGLIVFLRSSGLIWLVPVLLVAPMALQQAFISILMGTGDYIKLSRTAALGAITQVIFVGIVAWLNGGLRWFLVAVLAANLVSAFLYLAGLRDAASLHSSSPACAFSYRRLFQFSGPVAYLVLLDLVVWQRSEVWFLRRYSMWQELAFYSIAYLIVSRLTELLVSVTSTLLPMQSRHVGRADMAAAGRLQIQALCLMQICLLPVCFSIGLLAKPVILMLYGESYIRVLPALLVLLLSPIAISMTDVSVAGLYALDRQRSLIVPLTLTAALNLTLAYLLVPRWGAVGAAAANSTAQFTEGMFLLLFSVILFAVKVPWNRLLRIYAAAFVSFAPAAFMAWKGFSALPLFAVTALSCVVYVVALLMLDELDFGNQSELCIIPEAQHARG